MPMIFAFSSDDKGLEVFLDERQAIQSCEGIDVEEIPILFWDDSGQPLKATFTKRNERGLVSVRSGVYRLDPGGESPGLLSMLDQVAYVEGPENLMSVQAVRQHLTSQTSRDAVNGAPV